MALVNGNPQPGELYADVLFNTDLLPAFVKGDSGAPIAKVAAASILVLSIGTNTANPLTADAMRTRINIIISDQ